MSGPPPDIPPGTDDLEELAVADPPRLVELLPDGRLRAPSAETRERLRVRLSRAELLATGADWAVLRTLDAPGTDAGLAEQLEPQREVVCCGTLRESGISLIDFIGFLATGDQTGVLAVATQDVERSIYLHRGNVVWASSTCPDDRLGEFLVRRGKLTREQLQTAVSRHGETRLGRACVECGFIAAHELWNMVQAQLLEIFDRILSTEEGLWSFSRISSEALAESHIHLSTQGLLMDALRRLDEMRVYRQRIRSSDVLVQRLQIPDDELERRLARLKDVDPASAQSLLRHAPRAVTVLEMMRILGKGEFEVTRLVYHLLQAELVEIVAPELGTGPMPRKAERIDVEGVQEVLEVYSMALREMVQEVQTVHSPDTVIQAARAFLQDGSLPHAAILSQLRLLPDGQLDPALASRFRGTVEELNAALSELLFFVLFQATDMLGHRRGDDLARRVKLILALLSRNEAS